MSRKIIRIQMLGQQEDRFDEDRVKALTQESMGLRLFHRSNRPREGRRYRRGAG